MPPVLTMEVCSSSKRRRKTLGLGMMLFPEDGGCVLYNPKERRSEGKMMGDYLGSRFLANSGNWFLLLDSETNLYIVNDISKEKISLPPLESVVSGSSKINIKRVTDSEFTRKESDGCIYKFRSESVRGLLWVGEGGKNYVVVWFFDRYGHSTINFCKKGDTFYTEIPLHHDPWDRKLYGLSDMVLHGCRLYISTSRRYVRVLDLSAPEGCFDDITGRDPIPMFSDDDELDNSIAVTSSGELLLVESDLSEGFFRIYKKDTSIENSKDNCVTVIEVESLGGEALLLDLGYTVPANKSLGIEPDSIYFTRHYRPCQCMCQDLDICVFNLKRKSLDRIDLGNMKLKDARWFLPHI